MIRPASSIPLGHVGASGHQPGRRDVLRWAAASAAGLFGCGRPTRSDDLIGRIDDAARAAARALGAAQSDDGAWRSPTDGVVRVGRALTPAVLKAVAFGPDVPGVEEARRRGASYLAGRVRDDGSIDDGPTGMVYPVYSASASAVVLTRIGVPGGTRARDAWLAEVRRRQLDERYGWSPDDAAYGGWGYAIEPSTKVANKAPDADLSSTLFAVGALGVANTGTDGPAFARALRFVERCQNHGGGDPAFDDGGFFFSPTDPVRNKAGSSGMDRLGRTRYHSYGSCHGRWLLRAPPPLRCSRGPSPGRLGAGLARGEHRGDDEPRPFRAGPRAGAGRDVLLLRLVARPRRPGPRARARIRGIPGRGSGPRADPSAAPRRDLDQPIHGVQGGRPARRHLIRRRGARPLPSVARARACIAEGETNRGPDIHGRAARGHREPT